jgi:serine protease Do
MRTFLAGMLSLALVPCLAVAAPPTDPPAKAPAATRVFLGVGLQATAKNATPAGIVIREVRPDSPAAKAGLQPGDIITKVGDTEVKAAKAVADIVRSHKGGDKLLIHFIRNGKEETREVMLTEGPTEDALFQERSFPFGPHLGVLVQELTPERKQAGSLKIDKGVLIREVQPQAPAAKAGLQPNDVITEVNGTAVSTPEELRGALAKAKIGDELTLKVQRGLEAKEFKVKLEESPLGFHAVPGLNPHWSRDFSRTLDRDLAKRFEELRKMMRDFENDGASN